MVKKEQLLKEVAFKAVRSSGAGGQHVNKVSSKIQLSFDIAKSKVLNDVQKEWLLKNLASKLSKGQVLMLQSGLSRSQIKNKEIVIKRFFKIIESGLIIKKKRTKTKPSKASIRKRLKKKKLLSDKKQTRKKPELD